MNKLEYCITTIPDKIIVNKVIRINATHNQVILDENMSYQFGIAPLIEKKVGINNEIEIELVPIERLKEQDKEIERLKNIEVNNGIKATKIIEQEEEINRLNNIINEIEKSIDIRLKEFEDNKDYFIDEITLEDLKNELQELKGSDKK